MTEGRYGPSPCLKQLPGLLSFPFLCHRADVPVTHIMLRYCLGLLHHRGAAGQRCHRGERVGGPHFSAMVPGSAFPSYPCGPSFGREPVTTEEAEDYFEVISNPMDFQTMQSKCSCGNYRSVQEFLSDMKQVFSNAERYNQNGSHVLSCLEKTEQCLIDMVHKHLPGHMYVRRKRKKLSARCQGLEEQEGDSESEPLEHSRGRKRKK